MSIRDKLTKEGFVIINNVYTKEELCVCSCEINNYIKK